MLTSRRFTDNPTYALHSSVDEELSLIAAIVKRSKSDRYRETICDPPMRAQVYQPTSPLHRLTDKCDVSIPSNKQVAFGKALFLPSRSIFAVSKGATQGQSIYLILRSPQAQKRGVSKDVFWCRNGQVYGSRPFIQVAANVSFRATDNLRAGRQISRLG